MSDYNKATNFAVKDGYTTGNPSKAVKGTEIDDEFNAISSAIASKADLASPTFAGTPAAPTASVGTNTTQLATTAFVTAAIADEGLGTIATQNSNAVAITGGTITGTTVNGNAVGSNSVGARTVSTSSPTGGSDGDIWYKV